ncbi:MAG: transglutaminase domain-containing protein [Elusimicrobia bacterium]|nr:transglutaminase domain-containing protein [Elusimicrobiota bacterium]
MILLINLIGFLLVPRLCVAMSANQPLLRKIEIIDTNNFLAPGASSYPFDMTDNSALQKLRSYVAKRAAFEPANDPEVIIRVLDWVSAQWEHDGMNEPRKDESALDILKDVHERAKRYRCVEYGLVASELLRSLGYPARSVEIDSDDFTYGGFGRQHVAAEVWSNSLQKWVFIDPQNGAYPTFDGELLSFYDLYDLKRRGKFAAVQFNVTESFRKRYPDFNDHEFDRTYREFIARYFGHVATTVNLSGRKHLLALQLDDKTQALAFQGWPYENAVYTRKPEDFYPDMNRTLISFEYRNKRSGTKQELLLAQGIKTEEEYLAKMPLWAPKPDFIVSLANGSAWHSYYAYRTSRQGAWEHLDGNSMPWSLSAGDNFFEVRSINKMGIPGPSSFVVIRYH